ncbi:MAG: hypothetical protein ABH803_03800 [Candidatus Micrarchaeota archaeon]
MARIINTQKLQKMLSLFSQIHALPYEKRQKIKVAGEKWLKGIALDHYEEKSRLPTNEEWRTHKETAIDLYTLFLIERKHNPKTIEKEIEKYSKRIEKIKLPKINKLHEEFKIRKAA